MVTLLDMGTEQSLEVKMGDKTQLVDCTTLDLRHGQLYADIMTRPKKLGDVALLKELQIKIISTSAINSLQLSGCGKVYLNCNINSEIKLSDKSSVYISQNLHGN